jgi:hypothetical protein
MAAQAVTLPDAVPDSIESTNGPIEIKRSEASTMLERAVCVTVEFHRIGNRRRVESNQVEVDADKDLLAVSKQLLESPNLKAIRKLDTQIRDYLYNQCVQSGIKAGFYWVPIANIIDIDKRLYEFAAERTKLVAEWTTPANPGEPSPYEQQVEAAGPKLRALYNRSEYLTPASVAAAYSLEWEYMSFETPKKLKAVNPAFYAAQEKKIAAKIEEATDAVQQVLRANMAGLVDHLVDKLSGVGDNGKPKIFRESTVTNLREFLDGFKNKNITNDADLDELVGKAKDLLNGVDPKKLRSDEIMRDYVRDNFTEIKAKLDTMVVDKPKRAISFEDE